MQRKATGQLCPHLSLWRGREPRGLVQWVLPLLPPRECMLVRAMKQAADADAHAKYGRLSIHASSFVQNTGASMVVPGV